MTDTLSRGARAHALLDDELLKECLLEVANMAHRLFEEAQGDPGKLQRASDLLHSANYFARSLRSIAEYGQAEVNKREREISRGKRVERDPVLRGMAWRA